MHLNHWKALFESVILQRGASCYYAGAVTDLEADGDTITAVVSGTEDYDVEIIVDGSEVDEMTCTCPYAEDGAPCKHMAAVLFAVEHGDSVEDHKNEEENDPAPLIQALSEQDAKAILLRLARRNPDMLSEIRSMTKAGRPKEQLKDWMDWLHQLPNQYGDDYGFVSYEDAWDYAVDVQEILEQGVPTLLEACLPMDAFRLVCEAFEQLVMQESDEECDFQEATKDCCRYWRDIVAQADADQRREMRLWFIEKLRHNRWSWGEDEIEDLLFSAFKDPESLRSNIAALDDWIAQWQEKSHSYRLEMLLQRRVAQMEALGMGKAEQDAWLRQYDWNEWVRNHFIQQAKERGYWDEALCLLRESREMDEDKPGLTAEYSRQIIAILEQQGRQEKLREELQVYVTAYGQNDLSYLLKLKGLTPEPDWPALREILLEAQDDSYIAGDLMESEGLYDRLLEWSLRSSSVFYLDRYAKTLRKHFPHETLEFYLRWLNSQMSSASKRSSYEELARRLKTLRSWKGGRERTAELAAQWRMMYHRRRAMLEELSKAGF